MTRMSQEHIPNKQTRQTYGREVISMHPPAYAGNTVKLSYSKKLQTFQGSDCLGIHHTEIHRQNKTQHN